MKSKPTKRQLIPLVIGLVLSGSLVIIRRYYPLSDMAYGLLNGLAIGLMSFALLLKKKSDGKCSE